MRRSIHLIFVFIFVLGCCSCNETKSLEKDWQIIYKHDAQGNKLEGDKSLLIDIARLGYPIRIGFGGRRIRDTLKSVEHIAEAEFITVANGGEVFGQINEIYGQTPFLDADTLRIAVKEKNMWTIIIGTNGESSALSRHFIAENTQTSNRRNRAATWYAHVPINFKSNKAQPLW